ncbi:MAG: DUF5104 domain-containing protein [Oscillospiraceae bacterium]|nr:DUF5104 domain-containing protein [Oscillospiraceae bacterium]
MKRVICVIVLICLSFTLFGCSKSTDNKPNSKKELAKEIVACFNNEDVEGLENLFCTEIRESHNLNEDIQIMFDFVDGKIIEYSIENGSEGKSVEDGIVTKEEYGVQIRNTKTDTEHKYIIAYAYRSVDFEHPEKVGVSVISVKEYDGDDIVQESRVSAGKNV